MGVGDRVLIGSTVIEGDSTTTTVKRVATAMVTTVLKPPYPHKTLRSILQACDFVARCAVDDHGAPLAQGALFLTATSLRAAIPMETAIELVKFANPRFAPPITTSPVNDGLGARARARHCVAQPSAGATRS